MRKIAIIVSIIFFALTVAIVDVTAQTKSPTPTSKTVSTTPTETLNIDVQRLKDKIATKVAELRKESDTVVAGHIEKVEKNGVIVVTTEGKKFTLAYDDTVTKIISLLTGKAEEASFDDLKKGAYVVASGIPIEQVVNASIVYIDKEYAVVSGKVTDLDAKKFTLNVLTSEKDQYTFDIETSTKQSLLDTKTFKTQKTGFSKIKVGDTVHIVFEKSSDAKKSQFTALRLLVIPQEFFAPSK